VFTPTTTEEGELMPHIDNETARKVRGQLQRYNDVLARQIATQRLDELEAQLVEERQRRGLQPVTNDDGSVITWVRTR
jgi:hypothetical protein